MESLVKFVLWDRSATNGANTMQTLSAFFLRGVLAVALASASMAGSNAGPIEDAAAAYHSGNYSTAVRLFRSLADQGDAQAQYNLGVIYAGGRGVPQNYVLAHMWFNLSAARR
jgi:TPR repeat protein